MKKTVVYWTLLTLVAMKNLKWIRKPKNPWIDFILSPWVGYITLWVTRFCSMRREVGVTYQLLSFYLAQFSGLFTKKALLTTTSVVCFMSGVNNAHLFVITGINIFPGNRAVIKLWQALKGKIFQLCSSFS